MKCDKCGAELTADAKFCLECGAAQASQPVESNAVDSPSLAEAAIRSSDNGDHHTSKPKRVASGGFLWAAIIVAAVAAALLGAWLWIGKHPFSAKGRYELGAKYENGDGVSRDYSQAAYWYHKSAEQGNPNAQARLNLNDPMPSSCEMHLSDAQLRLIPESAQALNARIEDVHKYITPEIAAYALKQAWNDYQTESRLSHDRVCLAQWVSFVQGSQPSFLKSAEIPILPEESLSQIKDALALCAAGLGATSECEDLKKYDAGQRRMEANLLAIEMILKPSNAPGQFTFKLTNRTKNTHLFNIYFPLMMKDKAHNLSQKRAELTLPELQPGASVTMTMTEVPGWMDAIRDFYKVNNIHESASINAEFGSVSIRFQGDSQPSEFPFDWFDPAL